MKLSIVIPAYNESKNIKDTLGSIDDYLSTKNFSYEILVIANNCTDDTAQIVGEYAKTSNTTKLYDVKIAALPGECKGKAVKMGILEACGDFRLFMDADGSTKIEELEKFWKYFENGYDIVIASRHVRGSHIFVKQPWYRRVFGRIGNFFIRLFLLSGIYDTQCGFKVFTKSAVEKIFSKLETVGWGFDMEVLALGRKYGFKIAEVPINWYYTGFSGVNVRRAGPQVLKELFRIKNNIKRGHYDE